MIHLSRRSGAFREHSQALLSLLLAVFLVAAIPGGAPAGAVVQDDCTQVVHDDFRVDNSTVQDAANGSATRVNENTEVTVEQNKGFVRVDAKNPNGYCVDLRVEISPDVVLAADLGEIESEGGNHTATWRAVHDFQADETYTEVTIRLGSGESALFAPSKIRTTSLSWTGRVENKSRGTLDRVRDLFKDDLEQRKYYYSPKNSSTTYISIRLSNESTGQRVEDWQAMYKTPDTDGWRPLRTHGDDPVFYREVDDGDAIQFVFNDKNATVRFTANPTTREKFAHDWQSWKAGADILGDLLVVTPGPVLEIPRLEVAVSEVT